MSILDALFGRREAAKLAAAAAKPNRFRADAEKFAARCEVWRKLLKAGGENGGHIGVVVSPWISTPVPFFALECAMALARTGLRVSVIWDGMEIVGNVPDKKHVEVIAGVLKALPAGTSVIDISGAAMKPATDDAEHARRIVYENAVRNVRGEMNVGDFFAAHPGAEEATREHISRIRGGLTKREFDWLLMPGGIFGVSAVYVAMARELGMGYSTFDSGPGRLRLTHDGVAAHLADLPRAYEIVTREMDAVALQKGREMGREELARRTEGRDDRGFQVAAATGGRERCDVLMPLNIRWDSAALSRQRLFASVEENIEAVLEWAAGQRGITVCIRQHPNERRDHLKGSDHWSGLIERFEHLGERVRWIGAAEPVSTYDLIRAARVVLPHTSTVGVEAALLGRPVVVSTQVYYDGFSFVQKPATREEFFAMIEGALRGEPEVSDAGKNEAALVYFLTQQCAVMRTRFTPQNDDYNEWMETTPEELWEEDETGDFLKALRTRAPLAAIRARRILG